MFWKSWYFNVSWAVMNLIKALRAVSVESFLTSGIRFTINFCNVLEVLDKATNSPSCDGSVGLRFLM